MDATGGSIRPRGFLALSSPFRGSGSLDASPGPTRLVPQGVQYMNSSFADLGVSAPVTAALSRLGVTTPFAIQRLVIAEVLARRDGLAQSAPGAGEKTA